MRSIHRRSFLKHAASAATLAGVWPSGSAFSETAPGPFKEVYVVFKTHLDVGFTDFASVVIDRYIEHFIPKAMSLAAELRNREGKPGMIWTTGSWLVWEFLERAEPGPRKQMEDAIAAGDVAWHALPFTLHSELADPDHYRAGLSLSCKLDARFGKRTIAGKMTDVPGHTRAIVPLLQEAGVQFLHIGVNSASAAPEVPEVFRWRDEGSGAEVDMAYSKGGYGDLTVFEGMDTALFIAMTGDNQGPQTPEDIGKLYASLAKRFPGAQLVPARLDDYAADLALHRDRLPVITQELGDTWIHGVGSDPQGVYAYRELCRLAAGCKRDGWTAPQQDAFDAFYRRLLLLPEHTWGMDEKTFLNDDTNWDKAAFQAVHGNENYRKIEQSWADKRGNTDQAVSFLKDTPLYAEASACIGAPRLQGQTPDVKALRRADDPHRIFETSGFRMRFGANGAIEHLEHTASKTILASPENPLALFHYEVFPLEAFQRFYRAYVKEDSDWAKRDFGKVCGPEAEAAYAKAAPQYQSWTPSLEAVYESGSPDRPAVIAAVRGPEVACERYGCPRFFHLICTQSASEKNRLEIEFLWAKKDAVRVGEALWLSFSPLTGADSAWTFYKMGRPISPMEVVPGGGQHLHAVQPGVVHEDARGVLRIDSMAAPLCAPGKPALLQFDREKPDRTGGAHFLLYNNVWGTNFRSWYGEDARFAFSLTFEPTPARG